MYFENQTIRFEKVTPEHANVYFNWKNNLDVMHSTSSNLDLVTFEETQKFIDEISGDSSSKSYIIYYKQNDKPIGITSLINIDYKNRNSECIIDIGEKDYWGKGIGKQALSMLLDYAFNELNLHKVQLKVFSFNKRAIALYKKLGFKIEGELIESIYRNGKWESIILMAKFKRD